MSGGRREPSSSGTLDKSVASTMAIHRALDELEAHRAALARRRWARVSVPVTADWLRAEVASAKAAGCVVYAEYGGPTLVEWHADLERFGYRDSDGDWCPMDLENVLATCWRDTPPTAPNLDDLNPNNDGGSKA